MKLLQLHLLRFGHFSDKVLDFSTSGAQLHVLYGPNEAGKSTTLRAVRDVLFGIPERTDDGHRHALKELRIGAELQNNHSQRLYIIRRKGRSNTLLNADQQPLGDDALHPFIGATTRELFCAMFGLSHADLVAGGEALLAGGGELGESLFGASLGATGLHGLRITLAKEAETIFAPRAQNPSLNRAINQFKTARKTLAEQLLPARAWQDLQHQAETLQNQLAELEQREDALSAELSRLERLQRVLPLLQQRQSLAAQLAELRSQGTELLPESASQQRQQAQERLQQLAEQEQKQRTELARCQAECASLRLPAQLLAHAAELEALAHELPVCERALNDLPQVSASLATTRADLRQLARELGRDPETPAEQMTHWLLDAARQTRVRQLGQQGLQLTAELRGCDVELAALNDQQQVLQAQLARLPPLHDLAPLQQLLAELARQGDLEQRLHEAEQQTAVLARQSSEQLSALGLWHGAWQQFAALPLPLTETVQRYATELQQLHTQQQRLNEQHTGLRARLDQLCQQRAQLESQGKPPSVTELQQLRARRDALWQSLRQQGLSDSSTRAAYEQALQAADHAADLLWQNADRAAQYAALHLEHQHGQQTLTQLEQAQQALQTQQDDFTARWHALWQPCQIEPLSPVEMRDWLLRTDKLRTTLAHWQQQATLHGQLLQRRTTYCQQLQSLLLDYDCAAATKMQPTLTALLQQAQAFCNAQQTQSSERRELTRDLDRSATAQTQLQQRRQRAQQDYTAWQRDWQGASAALGLTADASAAEAEAVLGALTRLAAKLKDAQDFQTRIEQMQNYSAQFSARTGALCQACGAPELAALAAPAAAKTLLQRWRQGEKDLQSHTGLTRERQRIEQELAALRSAQEQTRQALQTLLAAAQANSLDDLLAAEQTAQTVRELQRQLANLSEQLSREQLPLAELENQAQASDPDSLPAELQRLTRERSELRQQLGQLRERRGQLRNQLDTMNGSRRAADAEAEAQTALASIKIQVEDYVRIRLSERLLARAIERYRERHQGPILARASALFARLTLGGFSQLNSAFNAADQPELRCQRATGEEVPVAGLSEGTRDQLYLALRLASLEYHAAHNEPLPLILDDLLIHFDDHRALAALQVLSELAVQLQVLFFTHHQRLVELAQTLPDQGRLQIHDLAR